MADGGTDPAAAAAACVHAAATLADVAPDAVRKLAWEPPGDGSPEAIDAFWDAEGVRPWQRALVVPVVAPLL